MKSVLKKGMKNVNFYFGAAFMQLFIMLPVFALSVYLLILTIKLARRGIKALDIYIEKNNREQR